MAAAVDSSSDDEGAWVTEEIEDGGADWFAEVVKASKSETSCESGESDWFEEAVSETDLEILRNPLSCLNFGSPDDRLRSLYGLKQAGRRWYQKLVEIMTKLGFARCEGDQAVFYRRCDKTNMLIVILVHVDDCSIVGKTTL